MKYSMSLVGLGLLVAAGCSVAQTQPSDSERFKEAIPDQKSVALAVPDSNGGAVGTQSTSLHLLSGGSGTASAQYYTLTRDLSRAVDGGSILVLGLIVAIVNQPVTTLEDKRAVWGPGSSSALEPAVYRFTVEEVAPLEYDYRLEGRPKTSTAEADFANVMYGHGYGNAHPLRRQGWFAVDNDAWHGIDGAHLDRGAVKITFDLAHIDDATKNNVLVAETLRAPAGMWRIGVTHKPDGSGLVDLDSIADISQPKNGTLETVSLKSRWINSGAGRGDATIQGGDVPAGAMVTATECWGADFLRVYYKDSAAISPEFGAVSSCIPQ
jgi:hypothetical protein